MQEYISIEQVQNRRNFAYKNSTWAIYFYIIISVASDLNSNILHIWYHYILFSLIFTRLVVTQSVYYKFAKHPPNFWFVGLPCLGSIKLFVITFCLSIINISVYTWKRMGQSLTLLCSKGIKQMFPCRE